MTSNIIFSVENDHVTFYINKNLYKAKFAVEAPTVAQVSHRHFWKAFKGPARVSIANFPDSLDRGKPSSLEEGWSLDVLMSRKTWVVWVHCFESSSHGYLKPFKFLKLETSEFLLWMKPGKKWTLSLTLRLNWPQYGRILIQNIVTETEISIIDQKIMGCYPIGDLSQRKSINHLNLFRWRLQNREQTARMIVIVLAAMQKECHFSSLI